jgi:hypothetical protein
MSIGEEGGWVREVKGIEVDCLLGDHDHLPLCGIAAGFIFESGPVIFSGNS